MSNLRKKLADRWDDAEKNVKEIENYLKDTGWDEENIALWVNSNYPNIKFIDTNTYTTVIYLTKEDKKIIEELKPLRDNCFTYNSYTELFISTLEDFKKVLNVLKG